jgi:hypothetical protein
MIGPIFLALLFLTASAELYDFFFEFGKLGIMRAPAGRTKSRLLWREDAQFPMLEETNFAMEIDWREGDGQSPSSWPIGQCQNRLGPKPINGGSTADDILVWGLLGGHSWRAGTLWAFVDSTSTTN